MTIPASIAINLGALIAKSIVKIILNETKFGDFGGDLIGMLIEQGVPEKDCKPVAKLLEEISDVVVKRVKSGLGEEFSKLDGGEWSALIYAVALTLNEAQVTNEKLIECNLNAITYGAYLKQTGSKQLQLAQLNEASSTLFPKLLNEIASEITEILPSLPNFSTSFARTVLQEHETLITLVTSLGDRDDLISKSFESEYRKIVRDNLDKLDLLGVRVVDEQQRKQRLSIAYIPLSVRSHQLSDQQFKQRSTTESTLIRQRDKITRNLAPAVVDEVLATGRRFVIRGDAGSGKTTLLQWIAVRTASQDLPQSLHFWNRLVPFFIRLRSCVTTGFPEPEKFPEQIARSMRGGCPTNWVRNLLRTGRAVVLIDGVDEMPKDRREQMRSDLAELMSAYPYAYYVVSSRPTAIRTESWPEWNEWVTKSEFNELVLQPMDMPQVDLLIEHWHAAVRDTSRDDQEQVLLEALPDQLKRLLRNRGREPLRKLATSPLLCAMICALHRERLHRLPSERVQLYEQCVEMLLTGRDEVRDLPSLKDYPALNHNQKLRLCQDFAYWLLQNDYSDVDRVLAANVFQRRADLMKLDEGTNGDSILSFYLDRTNLLREPVVGRIDFRHRTFQEYLAAQYAIEEGSLGVLVKHAADDSWRETIVLSAGIARKSEREDLLRKLVRASQHSRITNERRRKILTVALASLETATAIEFSDIVQQEVLDATASLIPPLNEEDARMIAKAGEPAVELLSVFEPTDNKTAAYCIYTLAGVGSENALSVIERITKGLQPLRESHLDLLAEMYGRAIDMIDNVNYHERVLRFTPVMSITAKQAKLVPYLERVKHLFVRLEFDAGKQDGERAFDCVELGWLSGIPPLESLTLEFTSRGYLSSRFQSVPVELTTEGDFTVSVKHLTIKTNFYGHYFSGEGTISRGYLVYGIAKIDESLLSRFVNVQKLTLHGAAKSDLVHLLSLKFASNLSDLIIYVTDYEKLELPDNLNLRSLMVVSLLDMFDCNSLATTGSIESITLIAGDLFNINRLTQIKSLKHLYTDSAIDSSELRAHGIQVTDLRTEIKS